MSAYVRGRWFISSMTIGSSVRLLASSTAAAYSMMRCARFSAFSSTTDGSYHAAPSEENRTADLVDAYGLRRSLFDEKRWLC